MLNKYLRVLFFLPRFSPEGDEAPRLALADYAAAAGVTALHPLLPPEPPLAGRWDGFDYAEVDMIELENHRCLRVGCSLVEFGDMRPVLASGTPVPLAEDPAIPVAQAFSAACDRLLPEVAMILTQAQLGDREWIESKYPMIEAVNANGLADLRPGLLYLDPRFMEDWISTPARDARDEFPSATGRILFASEGAARWV